MVQKVYPDVLKVCEIFTSIQGESTYAGWPCLFVRLTGCNLRCTYCDTKYAYYNGYDMPIDDIVNNALGSDIKLVEITGGEPLLQSKTKTLINRLLDCGLKVLIETNGSVSIDGVNDRAIIIMDVKVPSSGMSDRMCYDNFKLLNPHSEVKFVIGNERDFLWSKKLVLKNNLDSKVTVLMSPAFGILEPARLVDWIISERLNIRINLQLHKYIFDENERGR